MTMTYCPLASGSDGNAAVLSAGNTRILIDAGLSGRAICQSLSSVGCDPASLSAIVISHEHTDHIKGAGVLSRKFDLPVYASRGTWPAMEKAIGDMSLKNAVVFDANRDFYIGDVGVFPFSISHDAADPVGFVFSTKGACAASATDLGYMSSSVMDAIKDADVVLLESNHDIDMLKKGRYPQALKQRILGRKGHLSNDDAASTLVKLASCGVKTFLLGHLSGENNREELAFSASKSALLGAGGVLDRDASIFVAHRGRPTACFQIG